MKTDYNWWEDPKNKAEVERVSWWNHPENKTNISLPVSIVQDGRWWVVGPNDDTKKLIGDFGGASQGKTEQEAIEQFWKMIKFHNTFLTRESLSYQRFVPFKKGPWGKIGGNWFSVFGIHINFRHGKNMKGGWYIPFTKLNISLSNDWLVYSRWKAKNLKSANS